MGKHPIQPLVTDDALRAPMAELFGIHVDDLRGLRAAIDCIPILR